jgi:glycosyltransferase involved in cell wall biosynthesis
MTIRVLHVLGGLARGGVERWLLHALGAVDRHELAMDFAVHAEGPCAYDDAARRLGALVFSCRDPHRPWLYAPRFLSLLEKHGPYDVVHSHVHHFSGLPLLLAAHAGVPVRIAHSHCEGLTGPGGLARHAYEATMVQLLRRHAVAWLACSEGAAQALFGDGWRSDPRLRVFRTAIDLDAFRGPPLARERLGLLPDDVAIAHVGSFTGAKNHRFLLEIAKAFAAVEPKARLVLIGDGPLRPAIEHQILESGLAGRVILAGERDDVPAALLAMDGFLLPSLREGLPLALLEAQAAGLPSVVSDTFTNEASVVSGLITRLPLSLPAAGWARALRAALRAPLLPWRDAALEQMQQSPFDLRANARALTSLYRELCRTAQLWKAG